MAGAELTAQRLAGTVLAPDGSSLVLAEWTAAASMSDEPVYQAPLHRHAEAEAWYVLAGTLRVRAGDRDHDISAGGAIVVPGETPHTFWNPGREPARYLLIMGARTHALIEAIHDTEDRSPAQIRELYLAHGATLLED